MKSLLLSVFVALVSLYAVADIHAQGLVKVSRFQGGKPTASELLTNGSQGKDFYFCLPMNDNPVQPVTAREIYVTASKNTTFTYEIPNVGYRRTFRVNALKVTTLKFGDVPMPEIAESETISYDGIRITCKDLISVYVYNGKSVSSDGYLAIPVASWGKDYIHLGYPDFNEFRNWKAGFAIVAAYQNTVVSIQLRSDKYGACAVVPNGVKTEGGRKYGTRWDITLQPGQCYLVQGDGTTKGVFDLSGSRITSTQPIGFITYHQRTMVPYFDHGGGRDHMCEMLPPVSTWGKTYVSVEFDRGGLGDIYRVVPLENGTNIIMENFEFGTGRKLQDGKVLSNLKSGQTMEIGEQRISNATTPLHYGVRGMSVWRGNKPFLLMHYSPSASWDNDNTYDPYMVYTVPSEQFTKATIFQSPDNPLYTNHFFNLIAQADTNDKEQKGLRSIKIDDKFVYTITPSFLGNRIPGTNYYYARVKVQNGPHYIKGDVPFGGEIYGYGIFDSYGWPAATAFRKLDQLDTLPPVLSRVEDCGDFTYKGTEIRNFKVTDVLDHVETGVNDIGFVDGVESYNYELKLLGSDGKEITDDLVPSGRLNADIQFQFNVIDKTKDAYAYFYVVDRALNMTFDSVVWTAPKLKVLPDPVDFGNVRVGKTKTVDVTITNPTDAPITIKEIALKGGSVFEVEHDKIPSEGLKIQPKQTLVVKVKYTPKNEHVTKAEYDLDSLLVKESCAPFKFPVIGRGVMPHIYVDDWDAGTVSKNSSLCYTQQFGGKGLLIRNTGTDTLNISDVDRSKISLPFELSNPTDPKFPIVIPPGGTVLLKEMCFKPTEENQYEIDVPFISDAPKSSKDKNVSNWRGVSLEPGPYVVGHDWGRVRIGRTVPARGFIANMGKDNVQCSEVRLNDASITDYVITATSRAINPPATIYANNKDTVWVDLNFSPTKESAIRNDLVGVFVGNGERKDKLTGEGFIEKIDPTGAEIVKPILVKDSIESSANTEYIVIANASKSAPLVINSLRIDATEDAANNIFPSEFTLLANPVGVTIDIDGAPLKIPFRFKPNSPLPLHKARVIINSNAEAAVPNPTGSADTSVFIVAHAYSVGANIYPLDFGNNLTCNKPEGDVIISTPVISSDVTITDVKLDGVDKQYFEIISPVGTALPHTLKADDTLKVHIRFKPDGVRKYAAKVQATADAFVLPLEAAVIGEGYTVNADFNVNMPSDLVELGKSGANTEVTVKGSSASWADAKVTKFIAQLSFNDDEFAFQNNSVIIGKNSVLDNTWRIVNQSIAEYPGKNVLTIEAEGTTPINANGDLFTCSMALLIPDGQRRFTVTLDKMQLIDKPSGEDRSCVVVRLQNDSTSINTCVMDLRYVSITPHTFAIMNVTPHPATGGNININYTVGLNVPTKIEIVNSLGVVVMTPVDQILKSGTYTANISTDALASGMYTVRMTAGSTYSSSKQLIITK